MTTDRGEGEGIIVPFDETIPSLTLLRSIYLPKNP